MATDYLVGPTTGSSQPRRILPDALSDLSLRQLLSFRAVADEGSFHGAADALDYTQSAISQHVMALEGALGVRLFDRSRGRRTVVLTEAGRLLLGHVETITDRLQAARADLLAYAAGETGTLRVGVYQSVGTRILPAIIGRFAEAWPGVEVQLREAASDDGPDGPRRARAAGHDVRRPARSRKAPFEGDRAHPRPVRPGGASGSPLAAMTSAPVDRADQRAAADRLPLVPAARTGSRTRSGWPAASRTSCSAARTTARSRRWPAPGSAARSCRCLRSTRRTRWWPSSRPTSSRAGSR